MKRTRKLRRALSLTLCALALIAVSVGATIAYLTDKDEVVNTFTVGDVQIDLNETDVDKDNDTKKNEYHLVPGQTFVKDPTVTIKANSEPSYVRIFVTVEDHIDLMKVCEAAGSLNLTEDIYTSRDPAYNGYVNFEKFATGLSAQWEFVGISLNRDSGNGTNFCRYEFRYNDTTEKKETDYTLDPLFTGIQIPGWMTNDMIKVLSEGYEYYGFEDNAIVIREVTNTSPHYQPFAIKIEAQAIQAEGFANADAAWAAFKVQNP